MSSKSSSRSSGKSREIEISVINASTVLKDQEIKAALPALQKQIDRDFFPAWGIGSSLNFVSKNAKVPTDTRWMVVSDNNDKAGVLGFHDLSPNGQPIGKIFPAKDMMVGAHWTVTASHEILEMLADPGINLSAFQQTGTNSGTFYAFEVCDPCQSENYSYLIDNVLVSDFLYPSWFETLGSSGGRYDHKGFVKKPFELLQGGFITVMDIPSGLGWYQKAGPKMKSNHREIPGSGSRRERRMRSAANWVVSSYQKRGHKVR